MHQSFSPRVGFIGAGRLATTLAMALHAAGACVTAVTSRTLASARKLADRVPGCVVEANADDLPTLTDIVFVTTPDDALAEAARAVKWRSGGSVVHCSGATEIAVLEPARAAGASIGGFHPLATFGDPDAALRALPGCTVAVEADPPLLGQLEALATAMGCPTITLPPGVRGIYHASGGFASQFVHALIDEATHLWRTFGVPPERSVPALLPLLKSTVAAIERVGPIQGMPGPVSRGDVGTVAKHVDHLSRLGGEHLDFYRILAQRTVVMALARGGIDDAAAARFSTLLDGRKA